MITLNSGIRRPFWSLLDVSAVVAIIGILSGVAFGTHRDTTAHFRITEVLFLSTEVRASAQEFRAVHGRWPSADEYVSSSTAMRRGEAVGTHTQRITHDDGGAVTFILKDGVTQGNGTAVSIRPAIAEVSSSPVLWVCGNAEPSPGFALHAKNRTDVDPALLPSACRKKQPGLQP